MRIFYSWLIANLEIASAIIFLPIIYAIFQNHPEIYAGKSMTVKLIGGSLLVAAAGGAPWTTGIANDIINLFATALGVLGCLAKFDYTYNTMWWCLGIGFVFAVVVAVFSARNFYDVVSLRWLYANSCAAKFEASALYSFGRFSAAFHLGALFPTLILCI